MRKKYITVVVAVVLCMAVFFMPVSAYQGIDVSQWQPNYNFSLAKSQGVQVVYLRSSLAENTKDASFDRHYQAAKSSGLYVGAYHFFYIGAGYTVSENVKNAVAAVKGKTFDCKYVIDVENEGLKDPNISKAELTDNVLQFASEFTEQTGIPCMLYASTYFIKDHFTADITKLPVWIADYRKNANLLENTHYLKWTGQQYTDAADFGNCLVDGDNFNDGIFIKTPTAISESSVTAPAGSGVYRVSKMPYAWNSKAKADFNVLYSNSSRAAGHKVSQGDKICIIGVNYSSQLAEVVYPVKGGYMHGYIKNTESLLSNRYYNKWRNGSTSETVCNTAGQKIGKIYPRETATVLYKTSKGYMILYGTSRGAETKTGVVKYAGK